MKATTLSRMALLKMTSPPASMKSVTQAGFTLIELLITVAIVGVLAAIALPSFQNAYQLQTIKTTVSDAHISLLLARSEAIKRNASVQIVSLANGWQVELVSDSTPFKTVDDMSSLVTVQCNINTNTAAEACPTPLVTYRRTGRIASFIEMRFFVASNNNVAMRCLTTSLSGRPYVEVDTDGDTTNGCN